MKQKKIARHGWRLLCTAAVVATVLIEGCSFGRVDSIEVLPTGRKLDLDRNVYGFVKGDLVEFQMWGVGKCTKARLNFGDGVVIYEDNIDFGEAGAIMPWVVKHSYQGWAGPKTIMAEGVTNCRGRVTAPIRIFMPSNTFGSYREDFQLAFRPGSLVCEPVPNVPPLRPNTLVNITGNSGPRLRINFNCIFCSFNPDGEPGSRAPNNFPFPGLRKYSLVLRVGTQLEQGGMNESFITRQSGPLEVCFNTDSLPLLDNTGAWSILIVVDESNAP
ncbi:MAG: hypothetical protein HZA05_07395 [Nitrospirae bacterium]|nr:hypothetical protein [Nitrospirota bacterium]